MNLRVREILFNNGVYADLNFDMVSNHRLGLILKPRRCKMRLDSSRM